MKKALWHAGYVAAAAWMTWAANLQFCVTDEGNDAHYLVLAAIFTLCWLGVRYAAPRMSRRRLGASLLWGTGLAFAMVIGAELASGEGGLWPYQPWELTAYRIIGLSMLFAAALLCWMVKPLHPNVLEDKAGDPKRWFFTAWAVIIISRIPYWLTFYPAVITYDTVNQYTEVFTGAFTNQHSLLHTLSIGLFLRLGSWMGFGEAASLSLYALAQIVVQAAVFAWIVAFLRRRAHTLWAPALALAYLALHPLHAQYAVTIWKDISFGLATTVLVLQMFRVMETEGACLQKRWFYAGLLCNLIAVPLLRSNGILVMMAAAACLLLWRPTRRRRSPWLVGVALAVVALIQIPLFGLLHIAQPRITEALSVPLQQIGFVVQYAYPLTEEQQERIDEVLPLDTIVEAYYPANVDNLKFHEEFNGELLQAQLGEYAKLWFEIGREHPAAFQEAHGLLTLRYWYPDIEPQARFYTNPQPSEEYKYYPTESITEAFAFLWNLSPMELIQARPLLTLLFSQGTLFWVLLAAGVCLWAGRKGRYLMVLALPLSVWAALMVTAPLAETRYIYSLYCCLPLMLWMMGMPKRLEPSPTAGDAIVSQHSRTYTETEENDHSKP